MSAADDTPQRPHRMTLTEVIERLTERRATSPAVPSFELSSKAPTAEQSKAGILAVYQWGVAVPVCDEYPTAREAFAAMRAFGDELRAEYTPTYEADLETKLAGSVAKLSDKRGGKDAPA